MRVLVITLTLLAMAIPATAQARPKKAKAVAKKKVQKKAISKKAVRKGKGRTIIVPMTVTARAQVPVLITIPVRSRHYTRPDLELKRAAFRSFRK